MIEWFNLPPILGMLPLLVFIVLALLGKSQIVLLFLATVIAMLLSGTGIGGYSTLLAESMGTDLTLIGLVILLSTALGKVLEQSGVSQTIVSGIINRVGVKTERRAIIVTFACSLLVCGILGTLGGGNSIIAPIIIPVVASAGLSKSTVGAIFHNAGELGLVLGPFSPTVVALMAITDLSYGKMLLVAALPFVIVWAVTAYFAIRRVQKATKETNPYTDVEYSETFVPTKRHKWLTVLFAASFVVFILYYILNMSSMGSIIGYLAFVMLMITIIMGVASGIKPNELFKTATGGMASALPLFFLFLLFGPLFTMMTDMGAFEALGQLFAGLVGNAGDGAVGQALVMILGSFVGGFGVEGTAVVQMQITHELFAPILAVVHMPVELWAMALVAASRITSSIYPTANMIGQMGIARSEDVKSMLKVGWVCAIVMMVFIVLYAFVGALFLY